MRQPRANPARNRQDAGAHDAQHIPPFALDLAADHTAIIDARFAPRVGRQMRLDLRKLRFRQATADIDDPLACPWPHRASDLRSISQAESDGAYERLYFPDPGHAERNAEATGLSNVQLIAAFRGYAQKA